MLQVTFSNRSERLLDALLADMDSAPASPFTPEHVIVPAAAQRRAITLALARHRGICANVRFAFLGEWLWAQMAHFVPLADASPFAAPALVWRIRELFDAAAFAPRLGAVRAYVDAADPLLRYELARETAARLETYVTYRPDWLARWAAGETVAELAGDAVGARHEAWQAALWAQIAGDVGADRQHPSHAFFAAIERLGPTAARRAGLPERAYFFALPSIPPLYLRILARLGRWIDLRLYLLNPCREYWYEIVDRRRLHWLENRGRAAHHEVGNALLAGWGRQTRAAIDLLLEEGGDELVTDDERFAAADGGTLLAAVQNAVRDLVELEPGSLAAIAADRSIEVHSCHSLARQLEVLRDQLLALFDADATLRPADVFVLVPDLDAAAPLIEAVFSGDGERRIPFAITGRSAESVNPVADLLLRLLALPASRLAAAEIFDLVQHPLLVRRLGLDAEGLERLHGWMHDSGMRWGLDAGQRDGDAAFSLRDGLRRLLLGHALPATGGEPATCAGVHPAGDAFGTAGADLGILWQFVEALAATLESLRRPQPAAAWPRLLHGLLADWVEAGDADTIAALRGVRAAIDRLAADLATAAASAPIAVDVVRAALAERLDSGGHGGVATGAVTFSTPVALRGLPARLLCVLGLDDGVFPRPWRPGEFDLMARAPRRGDRQCGDDDRNLFLDLVLAARQRLQLYFTGRSSRDNAPLPPSLLVAELLDTLAAAIAPAGADADALARGRAGLIVEHPLQSFALSAFQTDDPRRPSYDAETCAAWRQALAAAPRLAAGGEADAVAAVPALPFFAAPLPPPDAAWRSVGLARLRAFFRHPARALLRDRLQLRFDRDDEALADEDPFALDRPARRQLWSALVPVAAADTATARAMRLAPAGAVGDVLLGDELEAIRAFAAEIAAAQRAEAREPHPFRLDLALAAEDWQLHGLLAELRADGQLVVRSDDAGGRDLLDAWLRHLALNAAPAPGVAPVTTLLARNGRFRFNPVADAGERLAELLALYRRGLSAPLRFFPRSAWAFIDGGESFARARAVWSPSTGAFAGEADDPWWRLALRGVDEALDDDFATLARTIYGPLCAALEDAPERGK